MPAATAPATTVPTLTLRLGRDADDRRQLRRSTSLREHSTTARSRARYVQHGPLYRVPARPTCAQSGATELSTRRRRSTRSRRPRMGIEGRWPRRSRRRLHRERATSQLCSASHRAARCRTHSNRHDRRRGRGIERFDAARHRDGDARVAGAASAAERPAPSLPIAIASGRAELRRTGGRRRARPSRRRGRPRDDRRAPSREVDVLEDRRVRKCAPCPARSTLGDHANAQCFDSSTCSTPAAAAVRSIEPTLPGSCTSSSSRLKSAARGARGAASRRRRARRCRPATRRAPRTARRARQDVAPAARAQRAMHARSRERLVGDDQRFRRAEAIAVDLDQVLAFEHAAAGLAPVARRGDQPRRASSGADYRAR